MLEGGDGHDILQGQAGHDTLLAQAGDDQLFGGDGFDVMYGGAGNDRLNSGFGFDEAFGDGGADIFQINSSPGDLEVRIWDFTPGEDRIDVSAVPGTTGSNVFFVATSTFRPNDSVIVTTPNDTAFTLVGITLAEAQAGFASWLV